MKTYEEATALLNEIYADRTDSLDNLSSHELEAMVDTIAFIYGVDGWQVMKDAGLA